MMEYHTGDWNKKILLENFSDLLDNDFEGWDRINDNLMTVKIFYTQKKEVDTQKEILAWVDDYCEGYFYSNIFYTDGGTPIVRTGDKVGLAITFQKKEDAVAFKLKWL